MLSRSTRNRWRRSIQRVCWRLTRRATPCSSTMATSRTPRASPHNGTTFSRRSSRSRRACRTWRCRETTSAIGRARAGAGTSRTAAASAAWRLNGACACRCQARTSGGMHSTGVLCTSFSTAPSTRSSLDRSSTTLLSTTCRRSTAPRRRGWWSAATAPYTSAAPQPRGPTATRSCRRRCARHSSRCCCATTLTSHCTATTTRINARALWEAECV
mmetsp:Transcript_10007/g.30195  ORF Transcript_10007/g.30195 Transcript_10007/m.30195 type:complete len:215 (+) Transcript_10007:1192-1836(+)